jgi:hypothetical protein
VGHPAPFPVDLPKRLLELYTYENDVVLDPFMGSGTTAVAAVRTGRHFIGFETDRSYVTRANKRIAEEKERLLRGDDAPFRVSLPAVPSTEKKADFLAHAVREGKQAKDFARLLLEGCEFVDIRSDVKLPRLGIELSFVASDQTGREWAFEVSGTFSSSRAGLRRSDALWKSLGKAAVLREGRNDLSLVLLTTDAPAKGTGGFAALESLRGVGGSVYDVVELLNAKDQDRLRKYALKGRSD